ncbi:ABC transporter ATP-binding protein [Corynebacterium choanae]|uniref:Putative siderophore transport system ATP-binding protein YusV n=1 Tax=Corynebacterium choanae TaxID=1862358 RepID=A0A3G6J8D3_9CORY|nr:ABC transporter ATP-binding protein [Corynebacterium choanae]AZA14033.1 putative siderophore transport system ATP-binding protein YusV [Corynebacterium choanae]
MNDIFTLTDVTLCYDAQPIVEDFNVRIPRGKITTIIGPNGCGKSTLLASLCQALTPTTGTITYLGTDLRTLRPRQRAQQIALLPQSPIAPPGTLVGQLVARGRYPHRSVWQPWSAEDEQMVTQALDEVGLESLRDAPLNALSGGQRQRVWLAMALAQHTPTLLLDEPTTYLDIAHAIDVLTLVRQLRTQHDNTVVMVLHDLTLAARFSDHLIVLDQHGQLIAAGDPATILTPAVIETAFAVSAAILPDPGGDGPLVVPLRTIH